MSSATARPGPSSRWMWGWSAVALALVVTSLLWAADQQARSHESSALAGCEHQLSEASVWSEIQLGSMVNYVSSSRDTAGLHLADLMAGPAHAVLPRVQRAHRACSRVRIEPWHFSLVSRRDATLAYAGALVTLLETVASQGRAHLHRAPTLIRLRRAAGLG